MSTTTAAPSPNQAGAWRRKSARAEASRRSSPIRPDANTTATMAANVVV